ncbi:hypothetical protein NG796_23420 [Laspinema sp. A4]|uniref:hypothetical protein n=1 Tax=Laspinema sp. D2d TaxID=2953686 RepID=UPI0021BADB49|nr:hypothetical protein [Laspinema sp. D2d]MCT7986227.1 hypothetical protein [Laspinema sp. D2d]
MKNSSTCFYLKQLTVLDTPGSSSLSTVESPRLPRHCCVPQATRSPQLPRLNELES